MAAKKTTAIATARTPLARQKTKPKATRKPALPRPTAQAKPPSNPSSGLVLGEGDPAPSFSLRDEGGNELASARLDGKPYVLYFYPKDDTPGCTAEACDFRDNLRGFNDAKVRVIGVSPDESSRHTKFKEKYGLTFTLLSDPDKELSTAYGVWVEKQNYGRLYMGVERSTFLVDKRGIIKRVWRKVRVAGHVAAVLAAL